MSDRLSSGDVMETVVNTGLEFRGDTSTEALRFFSIYMVFKIMTLSKITKREGVGGDSGGCVVLDAKERMFQRGERDHLCQMMLMDQVRLGLS